MLRESGPEAGPGTDVEIIQETDYPWDGNVSITLNPRQSRSFSVRLRVPDRMPSKLYRAEPQVAGLRSLSVNGAPVRPVIEKGYAVITRTWNAGDRIELELPLAAQRVWADERIEANRGRVALQYGPLVYNIEDHDQDIQQVLDRRSPLSPEWRHDLLEGVMTIRGRFVGGAPMLAIPNYARFNRVEGTPLPMRPEPRPDGSRPEPFPPRSIVWIREG